MAFTDPHDARTFRRYVTVNADGTIAAVHEFEASVEDPLPLAVEVIDFATTDPRSAGRSGAVGSTCIYVMGGVGTLLYKYGSGDTDWCVLAEALAAEPVTDDPRVGGLARPVGASVLYVYYSQQQHHGNLAFYEFLRLV